MATTLQRSCLAGPETDFLPFGAPQAAAITVEKVG